jgi:hypothetical protein
VDDVVYLVYLHLRQLEDDVEKKHRPLEVAIQVSAWNE